MPAFSLAPTAPLLIMFPLSHYGMHTVAQRTVRAAACREGCPILLLLSVMAVRSTGVVSAVGQPELSFMACAQVSAAPEPLSTVLTPIVALPILKVF